MKITLSNTKAKKVDEGAAVLIMEGAETEVLRNPNGEKTIAIGVGKREEMTLRKLRLLPRQIVALAKKNKQKKIRVIASEFLFPKVHISSRRLGELLASEFMLANFDFNKFKTKPKDGWPEVSEVIISGSVDKDFARGVSEGMIIGEEVNKTRELANTPGGDMTPRLLAAAARSALAGTKVKVTILDKAKIESLGMGGVLGVAQGSAEEPRFIILEYWGAGFPPKGKSGDQSKRPIVVVGKGVTFDTGGLNIKPSDHIYEMHMDMSGGAAVIHTIALAAKLGLKKNVIGLVPAVENMPSGSSYRPGDILYSMSGKTIEVLNTDAEGRIILADALTYANRYNPRLVIDTATLTGAIEVALGQRAAGIFTKNELLEKRVRELGEDTGEYVWPMPLWDEYEDEIKGTFGDWANLGRTRYGGAITAAMFLYQFTKDYPKDTSWLHIDMASRMVAMDGEYLSKGSVGSPVRLLVRLIEEY